MDSNETDRLVLDEIRIPCTTDGCQGDVVPQYIYLTSEKKLRVEGYCPVCHSGSFWEAKLLYLARDCPKRPSLVPSREELIAKQDASFLAALNISEPPPENNGTGSA